MPLGAVLCVVGYSAASLAIANSMQSICPIFTTKNVSKALPSVLSGEGQNHPLLQLRTATPDTLSEKSNLQNNIYEGWWRKEACVNVYLHKRILSKHRQRCLPGRKQNGGEGEKMLVGSSGHFFFFFNYTV